MEPFFFSVTEEEIRRERAKARDLRNTQWWKKRRGEGFCFYCKKKVSPKELTMDHIVPMIRGGKSIKGNVVPVCKECNNKKRYLLPSEWDEYLERLKNEEI